MNSGAFARYWNFMVQLLPSIRHGVWSMAVSSAWTVATGRERSAARLQFLNLITAAVDTEGKH
ncbi:MAG: hypothetical protein IPL01_11425 [Acidobacteria bacterium]|nr:hypothetical protein [Acidobacteriota bacterium]